MTSNLDLILNDTLKYIEKDSGINLDFVFNQFDNIKLLIGNDDFIDEFKHSITQLFDINKDGVFNSDDIELIKNLFENNDKQFVNIANICLKLFNICMNLIGKYNKPIMKMDTKALETLFFGSFVYVLFQYSDKTNETKHNIVSITITIYETLKAMNNTLHITNKIKDLLKEKNLCCFGKNNEIKLDANVNKNKIALRDIKTSINLINTINNLEKKYNQ